MSHTPATAAAHRKAAAFQLVVAGHRVVGVVGRMLAAEGGHRRPKAAEPAQEQGSPGEQPAAAGHRKAARILVVARPAVERASQGGTVANTAAADIHLMLAAAVSFHRLAVLCSPSHSMQKITLCL